MTNKRTDNGNGNSTATAIATAIVTAKKLPTLEYAVQRLGLLRGWRLLYECWLEAADEEFALVDHLGGEMVVEGEEKLFVAHDLLLPLGSVDGLELVEGLA
jgi:hypothetical protein